MRFGCLVIPRNSGKIGRSPDRRVLRLSGRLKARVLQGLGLVCAVGTGWVVRCIVARMADELMDGSKCWSHNINSWAGAS